MPSRWERFTQPRLLLAMAGGAIAVLGLICAGLWWAGSGLRATRAANAALERKDLVGALAILEAAYDDDSGPANLVRLTYASALRDRVDERLRAGDREAAIIAGRRAREVTVDGTPARVLADVLAARLAPIEAEWHFDSGRFAVAATQFLRLKNPRRAADAFRAGGEWSRAANLYLKIKDPAAALATFEEAEQFVALAELHERLGHEKPAQDAWRRAGNAAVKSRQWTEAQRCFGRANDPGAHVDALIAAGATARAVEAATNTDNTELQLRAFRAAGDEAAVRRVLARRGDRGAKLELLRETGAWPELARLHWREHRYAEAAEAFELAKHWGPAALGWYLARAPDKGRAALEKSFGANPGGAGFQALLDLLTTLPNRTQRESVAAQVRGALVPETQAFEIAALFAVVDAWKEAAPLFEKAGAWEESADAWTMARQPREAARVLKAAARAEGEFDILLRASAAARAIGDLATAREFGEKALQQALALRRSDAMARAFETLHEFERGMEHLLLLAEETLGKRPLDADEYFLAAKSLLRWQESRQWPAALASRADAMVQTLEFWRTQAPTLVIGRSSVRNVSGAPLERTAATLVVRNNSSLRIARMRLVLELHAAREQSAIVLPRATGLARRSEPGIPARDRRNLYVHTETILNLEPNAQITLELQLPNRITFGHWKVVFEDVEFVQDGTADPSRADSGSGTEL